MNGVWEQISSLFNTDWDKVKDYALSLLLTIIVTYAVVFIVRFTFHQIFKRTDLLSDKKEQTIESVIRNTSHYIAFFIIIIAAIKPFVNIQELLLAGGVIGIVIGFGAQKLIQDILAGGFFLFERQFQKGDFVHINGEVNGGTVEELGFRVVKIRLLNGKLMIVPNGEVRKLENGNVEKRRVFESVIVSFDENPSKIKKILEEVCVELNELQQAFLKKDKVTGGNVEDYQVHGLSSLDVSPLGFRFSIKATVTDEHYLEAVQQAKEILAQKIYDNKLKMPTQNITWEKGTGTVPQDKPEGELS
ncbi:mechanosensitive ion channel family protein [Aquibacillus koreensis]|uniref:Mechanosensitive ion channel family protein n=1 Tax=Aquibacillus koreensis TaxID=279446 RepID=A0A9X4AIS2_9BACI|nr:mechanosensitive ion channel family protein [Aquibacillus koreensis]MCT2535170.1 mechanosensitive ion channel family protein [Aquibacillus koreensis]MDC3421029.1 mechanosensitive ion channel family protein [Aquibacillus koreensis]